MRIKNKGKLLASLIKAKLFNKRIPVAVRWELTDRCVLRCGYCNIPANRRKEFSLKEISNILKQLADLGTQTISFSGGEPMLRDDIDQILEETSRLNISTEMNSTGFNIPKNIGKLKHLDFLKLSLDGAEEVHDLIRGKGSYRMAIEAAEAAKKAGLKFIFTTTLTKYNIGQLDGLIETAKKYGTFVAFQPLKKLCRGAEGIEELYPDSDEFKKAISKLVDYKKTSLGSLRNSLVGLRHIYNWPRYGKLKCWAGKVFCIIDTEGTLWPCDRISYDQKLPNCLRTDFKKALAVLPEVKCAGCGFCGVLELNFLMALKFGTIGSILKVT
jgi:MoaA/NifB/PqqE/SkfB family radical SAM enzyme